MLTVVVSRLGELLKQIWLQSALIPKTMAGGTRGVYNILDYNSSNLLSLNSTKPYTWNIIMQGSLGGWGTLNYLKERGYKPGNWLHR